MKNCMNIKYPSLSLDSEIYIYIFIYICQNFSFFQRSFIPVVLRIQYPFFFKELYHNNSTSTFFFSLTFLIFLFCCSEIDLNFLIITCTRRQKNNLEHFVFISIKNSVLGWALLYILRIANNGTLIKLFEEIYQILIEFVFAIITI